MPSDANQIACDHPKQRAHSHLQRQAAAQMLPLRQYNHQDAMAALSDHATASNQCGSCPCATQHTQGSSTHPSLPGDPSQKPAVLMEQIGRQDMQIHHCIEASWQLSCTCLGV